MTPVLFLLQRTSGAVLALAVAVHLATIAYAVHGNFTAGEIIARTEGNVTFLAFYLMFVVAVAVHAPIGLRNVLREWLSCKGPACDSALAALALVLFGLGVRAVTALYFA
jgi:succinate dehydrogenase subunit C